VTALVCPICTRLSPAGSQHCECGYNFESRESGLAHRAAEEARSHSLRRIAAGMALMFGTPALMYALVALVGVGVFPGLLPVVLILSIVPELAGCYHMVGGLGDFRRAGRMLRAAREMTPLPPARVIE
jgi:hypothetical protein